MRWRVILTHAVEGSVTFEPEGLMSAIIGLTRHPDFHTLIKEFKSSFRAYGSNGVQNGQRDWIKNIESTYGPDEVIDISVDYAPDNYVFENLYTGEIGIQTIIEGLELDHYLEFTPVQTGMWRNFVSRYDVPVNIQSPLSLNGDAVTVYTPETLRLPSQVIQYKGQYQQLDGWSQGRTVDQTILQLDWQDVIVDEINKFDTGYGYIEPIPVFDTVIGLFSAPYDGVYTIGLRFFTSHLESPIIGFDYWWHDVDTSFELRARKINDTAYQTGTNTPETVLNAGSPLGTDTFIRVDFTGEFTLKKGEQVAFYLVDTFTNLSIRSIFGVRRLNWILNPVVVASTGPLVLSGEQTIDGYLTSSDYVLVKDNPLLEENGVWQSAAGAWSRVPEMDVAAEFLDAAIVITVGSTNINSRWKQVNTVVNVGVDPVVWEPSFDTSREYYYPYSGIQTIENYLNITAETTFNETQVQSFLQHDVAASICDRITVPDSFYSELIGSQYTQARVYAEAGSWWNNALIKLIHTRGYTLSEKVFSISFKDFWEGFAPMFNPSLGYETINGEEKIVIRTKAEAYDDSSMSVLLSGVQRIKRKYGPDYFNGAKMGAATGKTEDISGIDDPQTRTAASILKNLGRVFTNLTTWIFQGLTIEQARRTTRIKSADYKYDDNIAIVEVTRTGANAYDPRLNEDFDSVTGMLNEDSRYNKHHTPTRFFLRWLDYLSGGLQKYLGTTFRFTGGEGNYDMVSEMVPGSAPDDYSGDPLAENANIAVGTNYLWVPKIFEIEHYLTFAEFKTIDANRNLAIGVSQSDEEHSAFFIDDMQFEIMTGQVKIIGKFKNEFDIKTVPPGSTITQGGKIFDATFDYSFE